MKGCLEGLRVLDIGQFLAGPSAATWLGDLGADVIKIERPTGDDHRRWGKPKNGQSLYWKLLSRNKRCMTLNLAVKEGQDIFLELVKQADIVIENFRPGKLDELGIGYQVLSQVNPGIVLLSISAYGQSGPYSMRPGFGTLAEAMSGYAFITGQPDGPPTLPAFGLADSVAGMAGAISLLAAIRHRDATGEGQHLDISLLEPLISILGPMFVEYDQLGTVPRRLGSRLPFSAPRNIYETKDGRAIAMSSSGQRAFERSMAAIGRADLITDERFKTNRDRGANVDALDKEIGDWCKAHTLEEAMEILVASDAAAAPVYNVPDIFEDPHAKERGVFASVEDEHLGTIRMQNIPVRMSKTPPKIKYAGRSLGEHNAEIYGDLLGCGEADLAKMKERGVI